jgi:hypothetical protein
MDIIWTIFEIFLFYLLYKFIFEFIIPIYQTTKQVKRKMNEMQEAMKNQQQYQNSRHQPTQNSDSQKKDIDSEYIDYEEVK